jgi:hypothetical protein
MHIAITEAAKSSVYPARPRFIIKINPKRPQTMPSGKAKFGPVPDWMEGTMDKTKRPHMPTLLSASLNVIPIGSLTMYDQIRIIAQNPEIISNGQLILLKFFCRETPDDPLLFFIVVFAINQPLLAL